MSFPIIIELLVGETWVEVGDDWSEEYAQHRAKFIRDNLEYFADLLREHHGWTGPQVIGRTRVRNVDSDKKGGGDGRD